MPRKKHLRLRMNLGKEVVYEKCAIVVHVKAVEMKADGFSKPYDPAKHEPFAKIVQGKESSMTQTMGGPLDITITQVMKEGRFKENKEDLRGI
jgi:hypothetical protein